MATLPPPITPGWTALLLQSKFKEDTDKAIFEALEKQRLSPNGLIKAYPASTEWDSWLSEAGIERKDDRGVIILALKELSSIGALKRTDFKAKGRMQVSSRTTQGLFMGEGAVITWRNPTVDAMFSFLLSKGFLFVKAPPNTGKTSLAQLVERKLEAKYSNYNQVFVSFGTAAPSGFNWSEFWKLETNDLVTWDEVCNCTKETVVILDEVQNTYALGKEHEFWIFVKGLLLGRYPLLKVLMFAAYASSSPTSLNATPVVIPSDHTMYLHPTKEIPSGMLLTEEEFEELINSFEKTVSWTLGQGARNKLARMTGRHVGCLEFALYHLKHHVVNIPLEHVDSKVMMILRSAPFHSVAIEQVRGLPKINDDVSPIMQNILDTVWQRGGVDNVTVDQRESDKLVKWGFLYPTNDGKLQFPSPIHELAFFVARYRSPKEKITFADFKPFLEEVITRMTPEALQNSKSIGLDGRLLERHWQMEFYRSATAILPYGHYTSPDFPPHQILEKYKDDDKAFLDFYVNDNLKWGFELLREGIDMEKHYAKFREGGIYRDMADQLADWAIIDLRSESKAIKDNPLDDRTRLYHVSYANDFSTATIKQWGQLEEKILPLVGVRSIPIVDKDDLHTK